MKTFADVKRRFKPGVMLQCIENTKRTELNGTLRRIEIVQTNAIACSRPPDYESRRGALFWTYFPKRKDVTIVDNDTFTMVLNPEVTVTLRFVEERKEAADA